MNTKSKSSIRVKLLAFFIGTFFGLRPTQDFISGFVEAIRNEGLIRPKPTNPKRITFQSTNKETSNIFLFEVIVVP